MTPDKPKGISKLRFWGQNRRVNRINDLPIFMQQRPYFARPDAGRIVGVMGDGSFGLSVGELETLARLDLPVTLIVLNNANYGWIKAGQKAHGGKYYNVDFSDSDHARIAKAYGFGDAGWKAPRSFTKL